MHPNEAVNFLVGGLIVVVYFLPMLIAKKRGTENFEAIFLVNVVFGWTVLGWIAALSWVIVEKRKVTSAIDSSHAPTADAAQAEGLADAVRWGRRYENKPDADKSIF